jgi:uncharacterized protein YegP (UPF0339 family)
METAIIIKKQQNDFVFELVASDDETRKKNATKIKNASLPAPPAPDAAGVPNEKPVGLAAVPLVFPAAPNENDAIQVFIFQMFAFALRRSRKGKQTMQLTANSSRIVISFNVAKARARNAVWRAAGRGQLKFLNIV